MTFVRGSPLRTQRKTTITDEEFQELLMKADSIQNEFFRLRAKALLCLLRLTGKRRSELAKLELNDFKVEEDKLIIHFTLLKKKRRFKVCGSCGSRNSVKASHCLNCGSNIENTPVQHRALTSDSFKAIPVSESLAKPILDYLAYLEKLTPKPRFFFPSVQSVFGESYVILPDKHLTGRQLFNIVRSLSPKVWLHLFRETVGADIIKQDSSLIGVFRVMRRLDLESYQTGFNYLRRYASDVITRQENVET